jgi:hypothetical protein
MTFTYYKLAMRRTLKYVLGATLFITLSNIPPLHTIFRLFDELIPAFDAYATKDKEFVYMGSINYLQEEGYYSRYKLMNPEADHTLYRTRPMNIGKFWRWYEFMTRDYWQYPYLEFESSSKNQAWRRYRKLYKPYVGSIPPRTHKDSLRAANHFELPDSVRAQKP